MKRLLPILFFLLASVSFGATTVPVQLLNPSGSSSGQAIVSTGPSSAPAWTTVANAGANTNITSLTGLTTPLGTWAGGLGANNSSANGVPIFSSGAATVTATTGSGSPVLGTSPTITTPNIVGATNGSSASAGSLGEFVCAQVTNGGSPSGCATNSNTPVSLTTATAANVTSISLTAGDWDICGDVYFNPNAATAVTVFIGQISTTSATLGTPPNLGSGFYVPVSETGLPYGASVGCMRQIFSSTTTIYLVAQSTFTTNTNAAYGYIWARRMH